MDLFDLNGTNEYFRGDKLRIARMAKMLSMEDLATRIGKTRQFVCKLEKGYEPSNEVLDSLCSALDITKNFLYSERNSHIETEKCHFRSLKTRTKTVTLSVKYRVEILSSIIKRLETEIELPEVNFPDVSDFNLANFSDIERLSESVRDYWGLGLGPISNLTEFLENTGIIVTETRGSDGKVDAFSVPNARPLVILDNLYANSCRNRFTLAHELGHLLFHDDIVTGDSETESQADYFASCFLLPRVSFTNEFPCAGEGRFDWDAMVEFKKRWKVSLKAIVFRASQLGLISKSKAKTAYMHLNTKGYVHNELGDEFITPEKVTVLHQMVNIIELSTWRQIISSLGISEKLFYNLYGIKHDHSTMYSRASLRLVS